MTEVIKMFTESEAESFTYRLKLSIESVGNSVAKYRTLIEEAQNSNIWQVLGFASWSAYFASLFEGSDMQLQPEKRAELVAFFSEQGMSTRAIAPVVGASQRTVANDLSKIAHLEVVPDPDGDTVTVSAIKTGPVLGLDGKTYTRKPDKPQQRPPLPKQAQRAVEDAQRAVERLDRVMKDDRFTANLGSITELVGRSADAIGDTVALFRRSLSVGRVKALEERQQGDMSAMVAVSAVGGLVDIEEITPEQAAAAIEHLKTVMRKLRERAEA